jgi:hypothetical protein
VVESADQHVEQFTKDNPEIKEWRRRVEGYIPSTRGIKNKVGLEMGIIRAFGAFVGSGSMGVGPPLALLAPIPRAAHHSLGGGFSWGWRDPTPPRVRVVAARRTLTTVGPITTTRGAIAIAEGALTRRGATTTRPRVAVTTTAGGEGFLRLRTVTGPMARFSTVEAITRELGRRATTTILNQCIGLRITKNRGGQVSKGLGGCIGIRDTTGRRPLWWINQILVGHGSSLTDVSVSQLFICHVGIGCISLQVSNFQQCFSQLGLHNSQGKPEVFIVVATSIQEGIQHVKGQVVVILSCICQFLSISPKICCHLHQVLARILVGLSW